MSKVVKTELTRIWLSLLGNPIVRVKLPENKLAYTAIRYCPHLEMQFALTKLYNSIEDMNKDLFLFGLYVSTWHDSHYVASIIPGDLTTWQRVKRSTLLFLGFSPLRLQIPVTIVND